MKKIIPLVILILFFSGNTEFLKAQQYSQLWGEEGSKWPNERLPDFSYAGFGFGEVPIPEVDTVLNVKDFGAFGDGKRNDTEAFKKALSQLKDGALYIPEGVYRITEVLEINKSNVVLRGADPQKTILYFPHYLSDVIENWGETTSGLPTSNYAWSGGFIKVSGDYQSQHITDITTQAKRGDQSLKIASAAGLEVGDRIEIKVTDDQKHALIQHLYSGDPDDINRWHGTHTASMICRITRISGNTISIDRRLRFDLSPAWQPEILSYNPSVSKVGIENLAFEFPNFPYQGHFTELGHNAIAFDDVSDCWVKNIRIKNADSGIFLDGRFCTIDGVIYESERKPDENRLSTGHHGIYLQDDDNLFTNFVFKTRFVHDITVSHCAGNVISNGSGVDLCFDHHKKAPYQNLFTNIHLGEGSQMWRSGGGRDLGRHAAARETFWNIRSALPQSWPEGYGPASMILVGVETHQPSVLDMSGKWLEAIPPAELYPQNLHQAQLKHRLKK